MKLVFFDIDGTLAHGLEVPASTQSAIKQLRKNGHKVLICTGRAISYVKKYFAQYADGYIAFNGRYGEMNGKVLYDHPVSPEKIHEIAQVLREEGAGFAFYNLDHGYFEGSDEDFVMMSKIWEPGFLVRSKQEKIEAYSCDVIYQSKGQMDHIALRLKDSCLFNDHGAHPSCDTTFYGIDKGTALQAMAKVLNVPIEDTYAFGDGCNDVVMMKACGHGIAMGNGVDDVKKAAEYITDSIDQEGIRKGLEHYELI